MSWCCCKKSNKLNFSLNICIYYVREGALRLQNCTPNCGILQVFDWVVHLQLLPDGALLFTKQIRASMQPPLFIWQGLFSCGQLSSMAVMPYILWLPKKGVWMPFWRLPKVSTLSNFLLQERDCEFKEVWKKSAKWAHMCIGLRCPIGPIELIVCEGQAEGVSQIVGDRTQPFRVWVDALYLLSARISIAQFTAALEYDQWIG